jgi:hypothetical protein
MRRSSGLTRVLWWFAALLQFFLPSVVAIADAQLEREAVSARAFAHVEAGTGRDCARAHQADCALCQHLTTPFTKPPKPAPPAATAHSQPTVAWTCPWRATSAGQRPTLPRAPPAF